MTHHIEAAAAIIADIDPALARVFVSQPHNRHSLAKAFHISLKGCVYASVADRIYDFIAVRIDMDRELRGVA